MSIVVRKAKRTDARDIVEFNRAMAHETEDKTLDVDILSLGVRRVFDDPRLGFYLVAEDDGKVAGCLLVTVEWSDWRNAEFWWIQSVYVHPDHRKRGVYTALHGEVEALARRHGDVCGIRLYVDQVNARAKRTYERLGMRPARYDLYESDLADPHAN